MDKLIFVLGIVLFAVVFIAGFNLPTTYDEAGPCYDERMNVINGLTCEVTVQKYAFLWFVALILVTAFVIFGMFREPKVTP